MADTYETSADIIAEMRSGRLSATVECESCGSEQEQRFTFHGLADRLEAALRREKAAIEADALAVGGIVGATAEKSSAVGDCAKMREALKRAWLFITATRESFAYVHEGLIERDKLCDDIDAALAAPPRNCDRFGGDYKKLNAAWFDWTGTPDGQNVDGTVKLTFAEWLLAPATEKEGGAK